MHGYYGYHYSTSFTTLVYTPDDVQGEIYPIKKLYHFITTFTVIVNYSVGIPLHIIMLTLLFYYGNHHKVRNINSYFCFLYLLCIYL